MAGIAALQARSASWQTRDSACAFRLARLQTRRRSAALGKETTRVVTTVRSHNGWCTRSLWIMSEKRGEIVRKFRLTLGVVWLPSRRHSDVALVSGTSCPLAHDWSPSSPVSPANAFIRFSVGAASWLAPAPNARATHERRSRRWHRCVPARHDRSYASATHTLTTGHRRAIGQLVHAWWRVELSRIGSCDCRRCPRARRERSASRCPGHVHVQNDRPGDVLRKRRPRLEHRRTRPCAVIWSGRPEWRRKWWAVPRWRIHRKRRRHVGAWQRAVCAEVHPPAGQLHVVSRRTRPAIARQPCVWPLLPKPVLRLHHVFGFRGYDVVRSR